LPLAVDRAMQGRYLSVGGAFDGEQVPVSPDGLVEASRQEVSKFVSRHLA
jgi:hypothetical protein